MVIPYPMCGRRKQKGGRLGLEAHGASVASTDTDLCRLLLAWHLSLFVYLVSFQTMKKWWRLEKELMPSFGSR